MHTVYATLSPFWEVELRAGEFSKGPVGGAIFVALYLLLIFRVEQLVTSTI